jgi:hypothetical protein
MQSSFRHFLAVIQAIFLFDQGYLPEPGLSTFLTLTLEAAGNIPTFRHQALLFLTFLNNGTAIASTVSEQRRNRTGRGRCTAEKKKSSSHVTIINDLRNGIFFEQKVKR